MIKLKNIEILKYKSFTTPQSINIEEDITVLVGMNESGKTSVLECLAKTNYFEDDEKFKFNETLDYPRKELKSISKSDSKPKAIICTYHISDELIGLIENRGEFKHEVRQFQKPYDNQQAEQISLMV
ncbi:AAA family ATPase [Acinetobacter pittii]|uniref:AAA family ATPase n=1 Tax=Acinetobacter pittii TaxID=48296 RepID=UPI001CFFCE37|nr:AAA family ATPase [Acinetobacter pittii]MCK0797265.1 AAA family ATPase [Acinetobacter pittii]UDF02005.1 AAA family ATPase [Acinetobacter pittii]